jgi:hypothetical protein
VYVVKGGAASFNSLDTGRQSAIVTTVINDEGNARMTITAKLQIGDWKTTCSLCGGNADPDDKYHTRGGLKPSGEGNTLADNNGCGVKFDGREPAVGARMYFIDGEMVPAYEVHEMHEGNANA